MYKIYMNFTMFLVFSLILGLQISVYGINRNEINEGVSANTERFNPPISEKIKIGPNVQDIESMAINPNRSEMYICDSTTGYIGIVDTNTKKIVEQIQMRSPVSIDVNIKTNRIYVAQAYDGKRWLSVVDGTTREVLQTLSLGPNPFHADGSQKPGNINKVRVNSKANKVYVVFQNTESGRKSGILAIDGRTNKILPTKFAYIAGIREVMLDEDNDRIVVDGYTEERPPAIFFLDGKSGNTLKSIYLYDSPIINEMVFNTKENVLYLFGQVHDNIIEVSRIESNGNIKNEIDVSLANLGICCNKQDFILSYNKKSNKIVGRITAVKEEGGPFNEKIFFFDCVTNDVSSIEFPSEFSTYGYNYPERVPERVVDVTRVLPNPETGLVYFSGKNKKTSTTNFESIIEVDSESKSTSNLINIDATQKLESIALNSSTGQVYVIDSANNTLFVIDGSSNKIINNITVGKNPTHVAVNEVSNSVYVVNYEDKNISIIDGTTSTIKGTLSLENTTPIRIAINSKTNTKYILSSNQEKTGYIYILDPNEKILGKLEISKEIDLVESNIHVNSASNRVYLLGAIRRSNKSDPIVYKLFSFDGNTNSSLEPIEQYQNVQLISINEKKNEIYIMMEENDGSSSTSRVTSHVIDGTTNKFIRRMNFVDSNFFPNRGYIVVDDFTDNLFLLNYRGQLFRIDKDYALKDVFIAPDDFDFRVPSKSSMLMQTESANNPKTNYLYILDKDKKRVIVIDKNTPVIDKRRKDLHSFIVQFEKHGHEGEPKRALYIEIEYDTPENILSYDLLFSSDNKTFDYKIVTNYIPYSYYSGYKDYVSVSTWVIPNDIPKTKKGAVKLILRNAAGTSITEAVVKNIRME